MNTPDNTPAAPETAAENPDIAELATMARRLDGELSVLSELVKEAAADSDIRALEARIAKLIGSLHAAQGRMCKVDKEKGGLWGLLKLLFSPQTQHVLRCAIAGAYPVLRELSGGVEEATPES